MPSFFARSVLMFDDLIEKVEQRSNHSELSKHVQEILGDAKKDLILYL